MAARPLDAIFFDIDDTLFSTTVFADKARRAAIDAMIRAGLEAEPDACMKELHEVIAEFTSNHEHHFDKMIQRLPTAASDNINRGVVVAAGVVAYHDTKWRELQVYDDVYEVLRWLSDKPVIRGIISAGRTVKQAEKLIRLKIYPFLTANAIFFTEQVAISKPNPKLYRRVAQNLGLDPKRCIYVGDNPTHDIDPAHAEDFIAVRSQRSGKYAGMGGEAKPDYTIQDFYQLRTLLQSEFGLA